MSLSPGTSMGQATGTITLDTSQLAKAVAAARQFATALDQAMNGAGNATKVAKTGFDSLGASLRDLRTELLAIGAGAGLLTKIGLEGALNLRNYTIAFKQFVGNQKEAEGLTNRLITLANKYGLEWEGVEQLGRALLPSLKGGAKELDGWISRAARLRSLFPAAPRGSETIAISEFLAGQPNSLMRRFNIPLNVINEATAKFSDLGQALDFILEKRGATEEAAVAMANAFVGVRNELTLLLAQGFTPLFQALQPILASFREFLSQLRETQPGLVTAGAGFVAFAAAGAPALLLLNQMIIAGEKLKALGILGGLGRAGVGVAAAAAGVGLNTVGNRVIGSITGNKEQANTSFSDSITYFKNGLAVITKALIDGAMYINHALIKAGEALFYVSGKIASALGDVWLKLGSILPAGMGGEAFNNAGNSLHQAAQNNEKINGLLDKYLTRMWAGGAQMKQGVQNFFMGGGGAGAADSGGGGFAGSGAGADMSERNKAINDWARSAARIEREAGQARLDAVRDYERSVAQTVAQYNLSALREEEDFQRGRARAIADFNRQIAELQADAAKRDARAESDYGEKVAEMREDSTERLTELEEDYAKNRERAARDHRDRLMDAAARLDAVAVRDEQRNFARQQQDAQENYDEQRSEIQKALDERIADELKAHQRRLSDAREADAERLADMQQAFAEQTAQEDLERAIRLQRQAEDHAQQLSEMAVAQSERLAQISQQAAEERAALNESFIEQLNALGIHRDAWLDAQKAQQAASLKLFNEYWIEFNKQFPNRLGPVQGPRPGFPTSFADFGFGSAQGQYAADVQGRAAAGGSVSNRSINVAEGAIVVNAGPQHDEGMIGREVERRLRSLLEEAAL